MDDYNDNGPTSSDTFIMSYDHMIIQRHIKKLYLRTDFDKTMDDIELPPSLESIHFGFDFNQNIDNIKFPDSVKFIHLGFRFNHPIDKVKFPSNLEEIHFSNSFDQKIDNVTFPETLHTVRVGVSNQLFNIEHIPMSVRTLDLSTMVNTSIMIIPLHIRKVIISKGCDVKTIKLPYDCVLEYE